MNRLRQSTGAAPSRGPADCVQDRTNTRKTRKTPHETYTDHVGNARNVTKMNQNRCPERSKEQLRCRTQCSKQPLKYFQNVSKIKENRGPEGSKIKEILENRGPGGTKSKKILLWMGLGALSGVFGRFGRNFMRSWTQDARSWGQDGSKSSPRWSILAPRWPSWGGLGGFWDHLEPNLVDFGRGLGGLAGDFGDILVHGWNSKNQWFSLGFSWFWRL